MPNRWYNHWKLTIINLTHEDLFGGDYPCGIGEESIKYKIAIYTLADPLTNSQLK
jgi:hypothetical protein